MLMLKKPLLLFQLLKQNVYISLDFFSTNSQKSNIDNLKQKRGP